jgi:hypothetical protein
MPADLKCIGVSTAKKSLPWLEATKGPKTNRLVTAATRRKYDKAPPTLSFLIPRITAAYQQVNVVRLAQPRQRRESRVSRPAARSLAL